MWKHVLFQRFWWFFWLALYSFLWREVDDKARMAALGTVLLVLLIPAFTHIAKATTGPAFVTPEYIRVGDALKNMGIGAGDSIAVAGGWTYQTGGRVYRESNAWDAYYACYLGARVTAAIFDADDGRDLPQRPAPKFWHIDQERLAHIKDLLGSLGVKAIVGFDRPPDSTPADWQQVAGTAYSILPINTSKTRP